MENPDVYTNVPHWLLYTLHEAGVSANELFVLMTLLHHKPNERGEIGLSRGGYVMSARDVAAYCGVPYGSVRNAIGSLKHKHIIEESRKLTRRGTRLTVYRLTVSAPSVDAEGVDDCNEPMTTCATDSSQHSNKYPINDLGSQVDVAVASQVREGNSASDSSLPSEPRLIAGARLRDAENRVENSFDEATFPQVDANGYQREARVDKKRQLEVQKTSAREQARSGGSRPDIPSLDEVMAFVDDNWEDGGTFWLVNAQDSVERWYDLCVMRGWRDANGMPIWDWRAMLRGLSDRFDRNFEESARARRSRRFCGHNPSQTTKYPRGAKSPARTSLSRSQSIAEKYREYDR